jgi:hypothetical protein
MRWIRLATPALLLALLAGCNSAGSGVNAPVSAGGCPDTLTITPADGNKHLCVALGGTVQVRLDTPAGVRWSPVESTGTALSQVGAPPPPPAQTSAFATYNAVARGSSMLKSFRPNCPPASPGGVQCHSIMQWQVTVDVK